MKPNPGESYESWAERVRMFEHGVALQDLAQGKDVNEIMERMSRRMLDKLLHPLYKEISSANKNIDLEESKRVYKEQYLDRNTPVADHVEGQIFDKPE